MRTLPFLLLALSSSATVAQAPLPGLLPQPVSMEQGQAGDHMLTQRGNVVIAPAELDNEARAVIADLARFGLHAERNTDSGGGRIELVLAPGSTAPSGYSLTVEGDRVRISGSDPAGIFHGSRTLLQLLEQAPPTADGNGRMLPALRINDAPRFGWRGAHLDVTRHFFPVSFVKRYIDVLARYKLNSFHWHLTDDQGWRIAIDRYPALTEIGGWRNGSMVGPYSDQTFDTLRYGGFYTKAEIREVVAYAAERHINVVPEIEMPGHAMAALTAYPHLGCTGGPYSVQRGWGVFDDVFCAGNDSVFAFLGHVIAEVVELFPSPIIHIGGDESPKVRWESCAACQARIKAEGLADEHELQSYFIRRMEKLVNAHGRNIIGWDEILEGGLAPNATVMSWRGEEGAISAAQNGNDAVMSPGSHCYFDHYQGDPSLEPLAFGGLTTLQQVYSFEPIPAALTPEQHHHIRGAQANMWTEYITTEAQLEYMLLPRLPALAEVLWSPREQRNETDFLKRIEAEFPRWDALGLNASRSIHQTRQIPAAGPTPGTVTVQLATGLPGSTIAFSTYSMAPADSLPLQQGTAAEPPVLRNSSRVVAWVADADKGRTPRSERNYHFNLATGRPVTLSVPPHRAYSMGGAFTLVDGIHGSSWRNKSEWLGWQQGVSATVDLGSLRTIGAVELGAAFAIDSWIHPPTAIHFSISKDGKKWTRLPSPSSEQVAPGKRVFRSTAQARGRYVRAEVEHIGKIPAGAAGAGEPAWLFLDELIVLP